MELRFSGVAMDGQGRFGREFVLPDVSRENDEGWISSFKLGTFNIKLDDLNACADNPIRMGSGGVRELDLRDDFPPQIYFPSHVLPNNTLFPSEEYPFSGDLQFWRAYISCGDKLDCYRCYMLRRVDSTYLDVIELVSDVHFRRDFGIKNRDELELSVFSNTRTINLD